MENGGSFRLLAFVDVTNKAVITIKYGEPVFALCKIPCDSVEEIFCGIINTENVLTVIHLLNDDARAMRYLGKVSE